MGKASRGKREQREADPLPAKFDFGPHFLLRTADQADVARAPASAEPERNQR